MMIDDVHIPTTPYRTVVDTALDGETVAARRLSASVVLDVTEDGQVVGGVHVFDTGRVLVLDHVTRSGRVTDKVRHLNPTEPARPNPNWTGLEWLVGVGGERSASTRSREVDRPRCPICADVLGDGDDDVCPTCDHRLA